MSTFVIVGGGLAGAKAAQALREQGPRARDRPDRRRAAAALRAPTAVEGATSSGDSPFEDAVVHPEQLVRGESRRPAPRDAVRGGRIPIGTASNWPTASGSAYDKLLLATGSSPRRLPVAGADARERAAPAHARGLRRDPRDVRARASGWSSSAAAGSAWRLPRPPARPAPTSRCSRPPSCRCCRARARSSRRCSPNCTASMASTCAPGCRWPRLSSTAARRAACASPTARSSRPMPCSSASARARRRAWPRARALPSTTACSSTRRLRTSDPDIYAAGDIARADHPRLGQRIRVEHWANALNQPARRRCGHARRDGEL